MIDVDNLTKLITSEYVNSPKFTRMVSLMVGLVKNVADLHHAISIMMNLDTASGKTLDLIGDILGLPRQVNFQPSVSSAILNDDYYRIILKAKVIKNQWDGTKEHFYEIWRVLFPNNPIFMVDNQNMTANILVLGLEDTLSHELITHGYIVPKPAGVKYLYGFLSDPPYFAFNTDNDLMKGWDLGNWVNWEE